jgi:hypothetical protein
MGGCSDVAQVTRPYVHIMSFGHLPQRSVMFNQAVLKRALITCVAIGAAACPAAASARAVERGDLAAAPPSVQTVHAHAVHGASVPTTTAFEWDDAGIGAAAAIVLLGAGGVAASGLRRRQTQPEAVS